MVNNNFSQQPMSYPSPMQIPQQQTSEMSVPIPPATQQNPSQQMTSPKNSETSTLPPKVMETKRENIDDNNHELKLKRIGVLSLSTYISLSSLAISLIGILILLPILFIMKSSMAGLEEVSMLTVTIVLLLAPVGIAIGVFILTIILIAISNLILKLTKGITIFVEEKE